MASGMFKNIRILILLYVLLMVAVAGWLAKARSTDWDEPLNVIVYAINGDGTAVSQNYIDEIQKSDFSDIEEFFEREAKVYKCTSSKPFGQRAV